MVKKRGLGGLGGSREVIPSPPSPGSLRGLALPIRQFPPTISPEVRGLMGVLPIRGDNPMGGPAPYWRERELEHNRAAKQQAYVPDEWLPPWLRPPAPLPQPTGPATPDNPDWYDPQAHPIPRAKRGRLNTKRKEREA